MELLNEREFEALDHLSAFSRCLPKIMGRGHDLREAVDKVHQLQTLIMSQAACRAYPDKFRLLEPPVDKQRRLRPRPC